MQKTLLLKAVLILVVFAVLMIPLRMIDGIVGERAARRLSVEQELAASSYGPQTIAGPVLTLPYVEEFDETVTEQRTQRVEHRRIERALHFFARSSVVEGDAAIETKSRGIFTVRVYTWRATMRGEFVVDTTAKLARARADSRITFRKPIVGMLVSDPRGLVGTPALEWGGRPIVFERGSDIAAASSGLHAEVPAFDPAEAQRIGYSITVALNGTQSLSIVPLADDDRTTLHSDWPHPSFGGQFLPLPQSKRASGSGFDAQWTLSALASNAQSQMLAILDNRSSCGGDYRCTDRIDVRFIEPIDIYSLSDRALKYGFLFIGLTFGCVALFELVKGLRIHPAQYLLVGLALATFFLLLLGLSEHAGFGIAYTVASAACVALIGHYLAAVLGGRLRGAAFAALLASLYAALYALLVSEDNALLLGSLLVFALLAAAMTLTRRLDWYSLNPQRA